MILINLHGVKEATKKVVIDGDKVTITIYAMDDKGEYVTLYLNGDESKNICELKIKNNEKV